MIRVSDILLGSMGKYLVTHKISFKQKKVVHKIINCFTEVSRYVVFVCNNKNCRNIEHMQQPCRDRHCNRCNNSKKMKWIRKIIKDFPPLPYYHVVFTLPSELHNLAICNPKIIYNVFFKSSFYVLNQFAKDVKFFGGNIGFFGLLHTWGQMLNYHPHIHFMVLAGGIKDGTYKKLPYKNDFIFPVTALSKVMMGKFIELLKEKYSKGELKFPGKLEEIASYQKFNNFLYLLSKKEWVVYSRKPFDGSVRVLEYIARYTHKVAIANHRIKSYKNGRVSFEYLDYKDKNSYGVPIKKIMQLSDMEFIRRFLLHILPDGFRKIRYGGIFASNQKANNISIIKETLKNELEELILKSSQFIDDIDKKLKIICKKCSGELIPYNIFAFSGFT